MVALDWKPIDENVILRGLQTQRLGKSLRIVDECSSTNDLVGQLAEAGAPHGLVVIGETQTAGRGRFGRAWYSPRGGIWLSVLLRPQNQSISFDSLPLLGALGIAKPISEHWGARARVRWPNDVVVDRQKIAGVLVESKTSGNRLEYATMGLGVNANFDPNQIEPIRGSSTSLLRLLGREVNREELILAILSATERMYESLAANRETDLAQVLEGLDCSRGSRVRVKTAEGVFEGVVDAYEGLGKVRIMTRRGHVSVETGTVVSVDYQSN